MLFAAAALGACSSSSSTPPPAGDGGVASGGGDDAGGAPMPSGTGPCSTGDQQACNQCIADATPSCDAGPCAQQDTDLQNCAVIYAGTACMDALGNAADCCAVEKQALVQCYAACPAVMACS